MTDQPPQGFPRELLKQPIEARRHYFEKKVVAHQHLKQVYEDLLHAVRYPAGTSLIWVVGPTGVGKTTLLQRLVKPLIEDAQNPAQQSPGGCIGTAATDAFAKALGAVCRTSTQAQREAT